VNDGDKSLVVSDQTLVSAAKRNTECIVPLYYEMLKSGPQQITSENIYRSMTWAYTSCNIGQISNDITKIWNSNKGVDLDVIKLLCLFNNYIIDGAKTLYVPERPEFLTTRMQKYTCDKVPHFFIEAKGKSEAQVSPINESCVNRIRHILPNIKLNFSAQRLGKFNWKMLTSNEIIPSNDITRRIVDVFQKRSSRMNFKFDDDDATNKHYVCYQLKQELLSIYPNINLIVDVLVRHLFYTTKSRRKVVFWECFGKEVLSNLRKNIDHNMIMCSECGVRIYKESPRQMMCKSCASKQRRRQDTARKRRLRHASAF